MHQSILSSIKDVIRESNEARLIEMEKEEANMKKKTNGAVGITTMQLLNATNSSAAGQRRQKLLLDAKMKQQMEFMIMYPLPIRMPKYANITVRRPGAPCITVVDDVWNGTVLDAFTKLTVTKCLLRNEYKIMRQRLLVMVFVESSMLMIHQSIMMAKDTLTHLDHVSSSPALGENLDGRVFAKEMY